MHLGSLALVPWAAQIPPSHWYIRCLRMTSHIWNPNKKMYSDAHSDMYVPAWPHTQSELWVLDGGSSLLQNWGVSTHRGGNLSEAKDRHWLILLCLKLNNQTLFFCDWINWINKLTLKGQHNSILFCFVYMCWTLPPFPLQTVFLGPHFPLRTVWYVNIKILEAPGMFCGLQLTLYQHGGDDDWV